MQTCLNISKFPHDHLPTLEGLQMIVFFWLRTPGPVQQAGSFDATSPWPFGSGHCKPWSKSGRCQEIGAEKYWKWDGKNGKSPNSQDVDCQITTVPVPAFNLAIICKYGINMSVFFVLQLTDLWESSLKGHNLQIAVLVANENRCGFNSPNEVYVRVRGLQPRFSGLVFVQMAKALDAFGC